MGNKYSSVAISGYNSSPPPDDGSNTAANEVTWAGIKGKLGDPVKTQAASIDAGVLAAFGQQFGYNIENVATDLTLGAGDTNKFIACTGNHTITLPAVATAGTSTLYAVINVGSGTTTIDGNGSETIDTALTITLKPGQFALLATDGSAWNSASNRQSSPLRGHLSGLTLSRNAGTPNTKIDVAAGQATDDTNVASMTLAATATIDTGTVGANGLDAGVLALSSWYHAYVIAKLDGTTAGLLSTSATSPTMPSGYVFKRRIGSVKTNASTQFLAFFQNGDDFLWDAAPALDVNSNNPGILAVTSTTTIPPGVRVRANLNVQLAELSVNNNAINFWSPDISNQLAGLSATPLGQIGLFTGGSNAAYGQVVVWSNASQQVKWAVAFSGANTTVRIQALGWTDTRGRFS